MNFSEKHIVSTYSNLFEGLSDVSKTALIEKLSKSLKTEKELKEINFFKSFGAFASNLSAKEIILDIKASRKFRNKQIEF